MFEFQLLQDVKNISLQDLFGAYSAINQANIDKGVAKTNNYINELNAQAELYRAQAQAWLLQNQPTAITGIDGRQLLMIAALIGAGVLAYKLIK